MDGWRDDISVQLVGLSEEEQATCRGGGLPDLARFMLQEAVRNWDDIERGFGSGSRC